MYFWKIFKENFTVGYEILCFITEILYLTVITPNWIYAKLLNIKKNRNLSYHGNKEFISAYRKQYGRHMRIKLFVNLS